MRSKLLTILLNLNASIIHFTLTLFFFYLYFSKGVEKHIAFVFTHHRPTFLALAFLFLLLSIFFLTVFYWNARQKYLHLSMGQSTVSANKKILEQYLNTYFNRLFPKIYIPFSVDIYKNTIEINTHLPFINFNRQKELFPKIEREIEGILEKVFGYKRIFFLNVSFEKAFPPCSSKSSTSH